MKIDNICKNCNKTFLSYPSTKRVFCSKECDVNFKIGINNPNYNKKWTEDQKQKQSDLVKSKVDDEYRLNCSKANKGVKFSPERIAVMHNHRERESYIHIPTEYTRKLIGLKSKEKFTIEYKIKNRQKREENGTWMPLDQKDDFEIYYKESNWCQKMFNIIEDKSQLELLKSYGVFDNKKNTKGIVRDHIFSRKSGFKHKVFPELLQHPMNCQILTHSENVKKKVGRYDDADHQTLEELFDKIIKYDKPWIKQQKCLQLIKEYNNGKRWKRK